MSEEHDAYGEDFEEHDTAATAAVPAQPSSADTRAASTSPNAITYVPSDTSRSTARKSGKQVTIHSPSATKKASAPQESASNPSLIVGQLQDWNEQLTAQSAQQAADIAQLQQSNDDSRQQAVQAQRQAEELSVQLQSLTTQYAALKQQHVSTLSSVAKLETASVDLLSDAVKEKNQRVELEQRLNKCDAALRREREDNARLRSERKEGTVQRKVQEEQWQQEREAWRLQAVELQARVQQLDDALKHSRQQEKENSTHLQRSQSLLRQRDDLLSSKDEELLTAIRRCTEYADQAAAAEQSIGRQEEALAEKQQAVLELERVVREQRETIRLQADRISSVEFQLSRIDEWRLRAEAEEREKAAVMLEMRGVVESQEKAVQAALLSKERSDGVIGILEERLGKEGRRTQEARDKQAETERACKAVLAQLREKEAAYDHLQIKYSHASSKWAQEQQLRQQDSRQQQLLERRYAELRDSTDGLLLQRQRLEDERLVSEEITADLRVQLEALRKKDESYRKIQDMLASSSSESSAALLALLTSSNEKYVRYSNPVAKGKLKLALQSPAGQRVKAMLRRCEVDSKQLLDWCIEPQRMVDGLQQLLTNVKQLRNVDAFSSRSRNAAAAGGSDSHDSSTGQRREEKEQDGSALSTTEYERELELLNARNAELNAAVVRAEAEKSKVLMRLVTTVAGKQTAAAVAASPSAPPETRVFLTELEGAEAEARPASASTAAAALSPTAAYARLGLDALLLAEMGLTDQHIGLMAPFVARCPTLRELDLRGNLLGNASAVSLVEACLSEGSSVGMIDLQQNRITLDGLEDIALAVLRVSKANAAADEEAAEEKREEEQEAAAAAPAGSGSRILGASLYRQAAVLLPILQVRLSGRLLLVDLRYNRLQHVQSGSAAASAGGESVKQLMRRVLQRVCRLLNSVGQGGSETLDKVDLDQRSEWMTEQEVDLALQRNTQRKQRDDRLKAELQTGFDTAYTPQPKRHTSGLDQRNTQSVRPVLPAAPTAASKRLTGGAAGKQLPSIGGRAGSRGSSAGKEAEEAKQQDEAAGARQRATSQYSEDEYAAEEFATSHNAHADAAAAE